MLYSAKKALRHLEPLREAEGYQDSINVVERAFRRSKSKSTHTIAAPGSSVIKPRNVSSIVCLLWLLLRQADAE